LFGISRVTNIEYVEECQALEEVSFGWEENMRASLEETAID
jgi:hypothetical protein